MAAAARPLLSLLSLALILGALLLQLFTVLSGGITSAPIDQFYFLQAATSGISGARNPSRWTFFAICGVDAATGHNADCGKAVPALPFDPARNFGTEQGVPAPLLGTKKFFLLSRFMFAFYLIALFFGVVALFTGMLALCSRLGGYLSSLNASIALFFQTLAATLMTVWVVQGRDAFRSAGLDAHVGVKSVAFTWTAMACYFVATVLFFLGGRTGSHGSSYNAYSSSSVSRKRSTRSTRSARSARSGRDRGSFLDGDAHGHRRSLKRDDYS